MQQIANNAIQGHFQNPDVILDGALDDLFNGQATNEVVQAVLEPEMVEEGNLPKRLKDAMRQLQQQIMYNIQRFIAWC